MTAHNLPEEFQTSTPSSALPVQRPVQPPNAFSEWVAIVIASVLGMGFVPKAPGTVGSAVALSVVWAVQTSGDIWLGSLVLSIASVLGFVLGLLTIARVEMRYGNDAACVVLDEVVGMWLVFVSPVVPRSAGWLVAGFVLFRVFDIWKPFPARWFNSRSGSVYVLMDDVVAALYAALVLHGAALWRQVVAVQ